MQDALYELELMPVRLAQKKLEMGERLFLYASGRLRGLVEIIATINALPSDTYRKSNAAVDCVQLWFKPCSKAAASDTTIDPRRLSFTRKSQLLNIPVTAISGSFFIKKIEDAWMINVDTSKKADTPQVE